MDHLWTTCGCRAFPVPGAQQAPAGGPQGFNGLEVDLVIHLGRAPHPIAQVDIGHARQARLGQVIEDHEPPQAAAGLLRVIEGIDHRQAVREQVHQGAGHQLPRPPVLGPPAILDQVAADRRVLDHGDEVGPDHVGHAAVRVPGPQVAAQQVELLEGGLGLHQPALQVGIAVQGLAVRAPGHMVRHRDPHRDTGRAGLAGRPVGNVLRAPEAPLGQAVIHRRPVGHGQVGKDLPLQPLGQVGAGGGRRQVEPELAGGKMLRHAADYTLNPCPRARVPGR